MSLQELFIFKRLHKALKVNIDREKVGFINIIVGSENDAVCVAANGSFELSTMAADELQERETNVVAIMSKMGALMNASQDSCRDL
jgi:hypothetical protein